MSQNNFEKRFGFFPATELYTAFVSTVPKAAR